MTKCTWKLTEGFIRKTLDHLKLKGGVGYCEWINVERLHTFEKEDGKKY